MVSINIDKQAGFCNGVEKAISSAEKLLDSSINTYTLGEMVHCPEEIKRLSDIGLKEISIEEVNNVKEAAVIIRAHGVTPETRSKLDSSPNLVVDLTCSIVKSLQQKVRLSSIQMAEVGGQLVIFGKKNHPEVIGLLGYCVGKCVVIEKPDESCTLDITHPLVVYAQTTANVKDFQNFIENLKSQYDEAGITQGSMRVYNTICGQMKRRVPELKLFAKRHEVVIFVSGESSSNGSYLAAICSHENVNTFKISSSEQLNKQWITGVKSIGITGATSTPVWLLKEVANEIRLMIEQ